MSGMDDYGSHGCILVAVERKLDNSIESVYCGIVGQNGIKPNTWYKWKASGDKIMLPKLYKLDSKGKIREWSIIVEGNTYTQIYGIKDGKMQHVSTEIKVGKNIGRANETTAEEQCRAEAESLWKKQRDRKGYTEDIPTEKPMRPMLAKSFDKDGKCIEFPCYVQKKYDGCVSGDTLIKTKEYGYKPISWIVDNQIECKVKSRNKNGNLEYKPITYHFKNKEMDEECQWYELELETGEKLTVTGNHPVYLPDLDCWRRVDELDGTENLMVF